MLGTLVFGEFLPLFSEDPLKLCQVGWGASLQSYFQVSPWMFDWVQVRAMAGPLKDIQRLVPKPRPCCHGCVLRVVILLEGEPSPQSEVLEHQRSPCTLLHSSVPRSWLVSQSLPLKNFSTSWSCYHHASIVGTAPRVNSLLFRPRS